MGTSAQRGSKLATTFSLVLLPLTMNAFFGSFGGAALACPIVGMFLA